jgi:peptide/nickel transport system permease protein
MKAFLIKRLLVLIPILFVVSVVIFFCIHLTPGDPARAILGEEASEERIQELRVQMHLDEPIIKQYLRWVGNILHGDLGESNLQLPVTTIIIEHIRPTLVVATLAQLIALLISLPLGIFAARHKGEAADNGVMVFSLLGISIPSFLLGLLLVLFFSVFLHFLPSSGYKDISGGIGNYFRYLVLPCLSLGMMQAALIARMVRASLLEVLGSDYIKMVRAKGLGEIKVVWLHALKNALIPIITAAGQSYVTLLAGATVIESIFNIPGVGQLIVNSIARRDYPVIQGIVLIITLISVLINLMVDLLYGFADPRVRIK